MQPAKTRSGESAIRAAVSPCLWEGMGTQSGELTKKKKRKTLKLIWSFYSRRHHLVLKSIRTLTKIFLWTAEKNGSQGQFCPERRVRIIRQNLSVYTKAHQHVWWCFEGAYIDLGKTTPRYRNPTLNKFSCNWVWSLFPIIALCWAGIFSRNMCFHVSFSMISVNFSKGGGPLVVQRTPCSLCHSHYKPKKQDRYSI